MNSLTSLMEFLAILWLGFITLAGLSYLKARFFGHRHQTDTRALAGFLSGGLFVTIVFVLLTVIAILLNQYLRSLL